MAVNNKSTLHFFLRLAGLTGGLLALVGLVLWLSIGLALPGIVVLVLGVVLLAGAVLKELHAILTAVTSQRGAMGFNVLAQLLLASVLVIGVNVFSFNYHTRVDLTTDRIFTLPEDIRRDMSKLQGETDIVVFVRHTGFGQGPNAKPDNYDSAAERKIIEKVRDLAEQFRALGPRFHVEVLDTTDESYKEKLDQIEKKSKTLADAIQAAPEDSIFFHAGGKIQRLAFHDLYQLDRTASLAANDKKGNLVLNYQGVGPFARRILNIEEKKPRIGVAVIHEILSTEDPRQPVLTMSGARKALVSHNFDAVDIILKKWSRFAPPEPAAYTFGESRFERLEEQRVALERVIKVREQQVTKTEQELKTWKETPLEKLNQLYTILLVQGWAQPRILKAEALEEVKKAKVPFKQFEISERLRRELVEEYGLDLEELQIDLREARKDLDQVTEEQRKLPVENLEEQRRITDLEAKMKRLLADVDLLILPRLTLLDIPREDVIPPRLYKMDEAQLKAVKEFIKAGKPVLACLGPVNDPERSFDPSSFEADSLEGLLVDLGFKLPKQTILYNVETKSFAEGAKDFATQVEVPVIPPVEFDWRPGDGLPGKAAGTGKRLPRHPIHASLQLTSRALAKGQVSELRLRHPRPVYFEGTGEAKVDHVLLMSSPKSWNEEKPFPTRERVPQFDPPKKDPKSGTVEEIRRGPFPLGVAAEVTPPTSWYSKGETPHKTRLAVIGHGGVFVGTDLNPVQEKLLLDTCNWLLGRDDLLARENETWSYPRVELSDEDNLLWQWGTRLGLPVAFVYVGMVVLMVRRMR